MQRIKTVVFAAVAITGLAFSAAADDAFIQSDGTQYIKTDYLANPSTKIVCDFSYTSATPVQQRVFGADDDAESGTVQLSFSSYINGNGCYAWAFKNDKGNWDTTNVKADTSRRVLTLDGPGNKATLTTGTTVNYSATISTARTKTSIWPLAIFVDNKSKNYTTLQNYGKAKLYSLVIYEDGIPVRYYLPYKSADGSVVGLKEMVSGAIVTKAAGNAFGSGGDIGANPEWNLPGYRKTAEGKTEYLISASAGTADGTVEVKLNGEARQENEVWASADDVVEITATPAAGKLFLKWNGPKGSFAANSFLSSATVTLRPVCPTALVANWATPKTRYWNPTVKAASDGFYKWNEAKNWLDGSGATGKPLIGDTVIFGSNNKGTAPHTVGEASNPLYELRYEDKATVSANQGSYALLAGGKGIQFFRNADCGGNWSGLTFVGDGIIPVNIAKNRVFAMQKACTKGSKAGYAGTPIVVKQGPGALINCNQSGTYTYSVPVTVIQEGRWDVTLTKAITGCVFGFDGAASKKLTFCYSSYTTDLTIENGGIFETNGAANHTIEANGKQGQVVFTGTPKYNPMVFSGKFTAGAGLKWSPATDDCTFVCSNAVSDTTGKVTVEKGTVKLVTGASFTAISELSVAAGAVFEVESGSGANFHGTVLALGGTKSKIKVPAGVTLAFDSASISGTAMSPGTYSADEGAGMRKAAWIEGAGTVTVKTGPENTATWSGGDAESRLTTRAANWLEGSVPDLASGSLLATFATGGSEASLGSSAAFNGLVFNNAFGGDSFTFTRNGNAGATVNANGITATDSAAATTWLMGWPLALGAAQTWDIGANNTFKLDSPLSGSAALTIQGKGTVHFNAASAHSGALEIKGGTVKVTANNGLGTKDRTVNYHHMLAKYVFSGDITLDAPMYSSDLCEVTNSFMTIEPGSHVTFNGNFGYKAQGGITFGTNSVTVFNGGLKFDTDGMKGQIYPYGAGTIIVSNKNISTVRAWQGMANNPITLELAAPYNILNDYSYWAKFKSGRLVTRVAKALDSTGNFLSLEDAEFDLDGNDQQVGLLATTAKTRITSARPAMLTVVSESDALNNQDGNYGGDNRVDKAVYSGQVSFKKPGAKPHAFGAVSPSTGAIEVSAGTVTMTADGKWPNASEVRVAGGSLVLKNAEAFGTNTAWRVTTKANSVVTLDFVGTNGCDRLYVDGKRKGGGVYGAIGSGADREVAWLTGTGFLKVTEHGVLILVK